MATSFPHTFSATISRIGASRASVEAPPRAELVGGPPPEFRGDATTWSPEHLLCAALGLCLFTTFEAYAQRAKLEIAGWRETVNAVVDRTPSGLRFSQFTVGLELSVAPGTAEQAREILERAKRDCLVSNALSTPVHVDARIRDHAYVATA